MRRSCPIYFLLLTLFWHSIAAAFPPKGSENSHTAQPETEAASAEPEPQAESTETIDPNTIPYESKRSLAVHLLALPAKIWRLVWTPIGWMIIYFETPKGKSNFIDYFLTEDRSAGFLPLISIGDNTPLALEFFAWDTQFFNTDWNFSANIQYANTQNNKIKFGLADSSLFGSNLYFDTRIRIFKDSDENYFIGGNDGEKNASETSYAIDQNLVTLGLGAKIKRVTLGIFSTANDVATRRGDEEEGDRFSQTQVVGTGRASLFGVGGQFLYDSRKTFPRLSNGQLISLMYRYNREFDDNRFEYHGFRLAATQYFTLPFLARHRRFAARGVIEKLWPLNGRQIPFYELSVLGNARTLRGFDEDRFRDLGSLLFNVEYRYPVWDYLDAVLFLDAGQVYSDFDQIAFDRFRYGFGTGLRVLTGLGATIRLEVGISKERARFLLQTERIF